MARAILLAPVARDLSLEGNAYRIPDATNGVLQAWDTNEREVFQALGDPALTIYTTRAAIPAVLRPYLIAVPCSDQRGAVVNQRLVRFADLQSAPYTRLGADGQPYACPGDFFRVRAGDGSLSVKLRAEMVAGDKPHTWEPIHLWCGIPDDLGET